MSVKIGHASIDERGKAQGGAAGDQTGTEVCTRAWYAKGWNKVIRPKDPAVAEKIAVAMEAACANNNIGYDQGQRTTLYVQAKAKNWNLSAISVKCECDCSSLVAVCVNAAGVAVSKDIYTGNEAKALKNTGKFEILTNSKYLTQDKYLKRGDILLKEGSHTAVALSNGAGIDTSGSASTPAGQSNVAAVAKEVITGKWGNGTDRINRLKSAGYDPEKVQAEVNRILKGGSSTKPIEEVAREVIQGKWGNGTTRKEKLEAAGYDYAKVQAAVNRLCK